MNLRIDARLDDEPELPEPDLALDLDPAAVEALLVSFDGGAAHTEDAILAEFTRWLGARGASPAARRAGLELAREALDLIGDPDAAWQALPVERWLDEAIARAPSAAASAIELARAFVSCLCDHGRISLHGQRVLQRRLAAPRRRGGAATPILAA